MSRIKEVAKFLSGMAAQEVIGHTFLEYSGLLPFKAFGIIVTPEYNILVIMFWIAVSAALIHYAWFTND